MQKANIYSLSEIRQRLQNNNLPFQGTTELETASFYFHQPAFYAATAIHAGNRVRSELLEAFEVDRQDRLQEEDPFTDHFIRNFPIQIIGRDSRFEYDINRERHRAVYETVKQSWELKVWKRKLTRNEIEIAQQKHDEFHKLMDIATEYLLTQNKYAVIFDCHSYNYQRDGRIDWHVSEKPDINIGTDAVNQSIFRDVIDTYLLQLSKIHVDGHQLSVKENDIFKGGYLARRLSKAHYNHLLVFAIEFKKLFMDERTGDVYEHRLKEFADHFEDTSKRIINHPLFQNSQMEE